jgi:xylan 1,4-beta-xylosidase
MIEYEIIRHDKIRGIRVFVNTIRFRSIHMHHDAEILYAIKGSGKVIVRNTSYAIQEGSCLLINAYDSHEIVSDAVPLTAVIIQFSPHFLQDYCDLRTVRFGLIDLQSVFAAEEYAQLKKEILQISCAYLEAADSFALYVISRLSDILYRFMMSGHAERVSEAEYTRRHRDEKRMKRISDYIEAHFQDAIRLADLAEREDITVTHLSHLIKDLFGVSFQEYLRNKRLEHALRLIHSGRPLSEISAEAGFSELKYMTAAFKETFHMTPAQYRRNVQQDPIETSMPNSSEYIWPDHGALPMLEQFL